MILHSKRIIAILNKKSYTFLVGNVRFSGFCLTLQLPFLKTFYSTITTPKCPKRFNLIIKNLKELSFQILFLFRWFIYFHIHCIVFLHLPNEIRNKISTISFLQWLMCKRYLLWFKTLNNVALAEIKKKRFSCKIRFA